MKANHELWHICPICGLEYDLRRHGYNCPNCDNTTIKNFNTMPIKKENIHLYPENWNEISKDIRSNRAKNRCENCGIINHSIIKRLPDGLTRTPSPQEWELINSRRKYSHDSYCGSLKYFGFFKVILTVAHLDHDPTNNNYSNLMALCQKCHNNYDKAHRQQTRKAQPKNQLSFLFSILFLLLSIVTNAQTKYIATVKTGNKTEVCKSNNPAKIDSFLTAQTGLTFKTDTIFTTQPFYYKEIYIEKKQPRRKHKNK